MSKTIEGWSGGYQGESVERAYIEAFHWKKSSEYQDNKEGIDLLTGNLEFPIVQTKSSLQIARNFLKESMKKTARLHKSQFIPLCIGEPAKTEEEVFDSIKKFGAWISPDVDGDVGNFLKYVAQIREMCYNPDRLEKMLAQLG